MEKAIICAAGSGKRMGQLCKNHGVKSKSLLPIGSTVIMDSIIDELWRVGVREFIVVVSEQNRDEIKTWFTGINFRPVVFVTQVGEGTARAVRSAVDNFLLGDRIKGTWIVWADMIFRFAASKCAFSNGVDENVIFVVGVDEARSDRFDAVLTMGKKVVGISPRSIPKEGPFFMSSGVFRLQSIAAFREACDDLSARKGELPIETVFLHMIENGVIFVARALDFMIDLGTESAYLRNRNLF